MNRIHAWKPVISKVENKLASWKAKLLSRAGRLTLIKSVLNSLPVYFMSMFRMPKGVAQKIVCLQRKFFWGTTANDQMMAPPVKWSSIELPKELGGLGVGNILHKNLVLLFKWWWRYSGSDNTLWKRILISVHNIKGLKANSESFGNIKMGTWAQLMSDDVETKRVRQLVEEDMSCVVGDGKTLRFWHDKWTSGGPLKTTFHRLFTISTQKDAMINQMGRWNGNDWIWELSWRRNLFEWEKEELERLNLTLMQIRLDNNNRDQLQWNGVKYQKFPIREIVKKLYESEAPIMTNRIIILDDS